MGEFCAGAPRSLDKRSIRFRGGRGAVLAAGPSGDAARGAPLPVLAGVLSHATAYLGNDSGISHLAAALGVPSVVLFAAEGIIWRPWADHLEPLVVSMPILDEVDVARVMGALVSLLG